MLQRLQTRKSGTFHLLLPELQCNVHTVSSFHISVLEGRHVFKEVTLCIEGIQCAELIAAGWWLPGLAGKAGDSQKIQPSKSAECRDIKAERQ